MKFCILSPLKSKRAEEVASKLLEMFLMLLLLKLKTVHNEKLYEIKSVHFKLQCSEGTFCYTSPHSYTRFSCLIMLSCCEMLAYCLIE
ncbi:hypothetical protein T05_15999 [Trichinella murrelli]|uniref:Uncharacterized protein n=1 Tax=Trichinella murrelli TaxID=144512 RepID=A0A0V0T752_9BILA|nr:hypothetical protein T05_15999 [Trichinella murrelli]